MNTKTPNKKPHIPIKRIEAAIQKSCGLKIDICKIAKISRTTLYKKCLQYPKLESMIKEKQEETLDIAESKLLELIKQGNITAIIFFLKTQGKGRGYSERTEMSLSHRIEKEIDLNKLTESGLQRVANGEDFMTVLADSSSWLDPTEMKLIR